jgi:hypothetical protein
MDNNNNNNDDNNNTPNLNESTVKNSDVHVNEDTKNNITLTGWKSFIVRIISVPLLVIPYILSDAAIDENGNPVKKFESRWWYPMSATFEN